MKKRADMEPLDENNIRELCRVGDPRAFDALTIAFGPRLYSFIIGMTGDKAMTDDILQETFIAACDRRAVSGSGSMASLLFKIARNKALDARRSESRRVERENRFESERVRDNPTAEEVAIRAEDRERIRGAINQLPERQSAALRLFAVSQLSIREIASVMECSEGAVMSHLHRARQSVRRTLGRDTKET